MIVLAIHPARRPITIQARIDIRVEPPLNIRCEFTCSLLKPRIRQVHRVYPDGNTGHLAGQNVRPSETARYDITKFSISNPQDFFARRSGVSAACTQARRDPQLGSRPWRAVRDARTCRAASRTWGR